MPVPRSYDKAHFLVYSNGVEPFRTNADAYCTAALRVGFATATHQTEEMLRETPFWAENAGILEQERGAGYWLWKPHILLEKLRSVGPDDIVIYNDAGRYRPGSFTCFPRFPHAAAELVARSPKRFIHSFITDWLVQGHYTKRDCLILMQADHKEMYLAPQISCAPLLYMPSEHSFAFLERWLELARDPRILTDQPDELGPPLPEFTDHRHDLAIASILAHQTGAHYFDLSKNGAYLAAEDIRRRNRHVPRCQTHIGYLSLMIERALPDDFFTREGAALHEAAGVLRNLTMGEAVPQTPETVSAAVLRVEAAEMLQAGTPALSRDHIRAAVSGNRIVATKLHGLAKLEETGDFWQLAETEANRRAAAMDGEPDEAAIAGLCLDALRAAEAAHPHLRREMMLTYVWSCLDDDLRALFKSRFKNVKSRQGRDAMLAFLDASDPDDLLPPAQEREGAHRPVAARIGEALRKWLVIPGDSAATG